MAAFRHEDIREDYLICVNPLRQLTLPSATEAPPS